MKHTLCVLLLLPFLLFTCQGQRNDATVIGGMTHPPAYQVVLHDCFFSTEWTLGEQRKNLGYWKFIKDEKPTRTPNQQGALLTTEVFSLKILSCSRPTNDNLLTVPSISVTRTFVKPKEV